MIDDKLRELQVAIDALAARRAPGLRRAERERVRWQQEEAEAERRRRDNLPLAEEVLAKARTLAEKLTFRQLRRLGHEGLPLVVHETWSAALLPGGAISYRVSALGFGAAWELASPEDVVEHLAGGHLAVLSDALSDPARVTDAIGKNAW